MNNDLARDIIEKEVLHTYIILYTESEKNNNKEDAERYGGIIDALYLALDEMEQNDKFREAINEFTTL